MSITQYPDYGFKSNFVTVDGYRMHYVDEGKGETILMLHGNPAWSYLYRHFINNLKDSYRCVVPDHIGFGYSEKPPYADLSMRAQAMRLGAFVDKLGLENITIVVQDWGGIIGLSWAARNKSRIKRLVIMNTAAFMPDTPGDLLKMRPFPWGLFLLYPLKVPVLGEIFVQGLNGFAKYLIPLGISHKERLTEDVMRGYTDPYPTWNSRRAHLESCRQIPMFTGDPVWKLLVETGAELADWYIPTQIIWGMDDPVFVPWFLEEFERRLMNRAPTLKIPGCSHFLQDDTPDVIVRRIRQFMEFSTKKGNVKVMKASA